MEHTKKKKILLIEDNPSFLKVVEMKLDASGYHIISAEDGLTGFNMAKSENPDLVICDLMLPKMNGHQICRFLKYDRNYKSIPFIVLTSRDMDKDKKIARNCGADKFLVKTVSHNTLIETIEQVI